MKPLFNGRVASVLLVMLFIVVGSSLVIAAKPDCSVGPPYHPSCKIDDPDPPDDSGYVLTDSPNWVIWGNGVADRLIGLPYEIDLADEAEPRFCGGDGAEILDPNPQAGVKYICHQSADFLYSRHDYPWNMVHLDFRGLAGDDQFVASGTQSDLCNRLLYPDTDLSEDGSGYSPLPGYYPLIMAPKRDTPANTLDPSKVDPDPWNMGRLYMYFISMDPTWNDGLCVDGNRENGCNAKVFISAYFHNDCNTRKCGRYIMMEAWGLVDPNTDTRIDERIEINPFSDDYRVIDIDELTVVFNGVGRDKTMATCYYNNAKGLPIKFYAYKDYMPTP